MRREPPTDPLLTEEAYGDGVHAGESWADVCATIDAARPGDEHYRHPLPSKPRCPYSGAAMQAWWDGFDSGVAAVREAAQLATEGLR